MQELLCLAWQLLHVWSACFTAPVLRLTCPPPFCPACLPLRNKDGYLGQDELKGLLVVLTPGGEAVQSAEMLAAVTKKITKKYAGGAQQKRGPG
jgi:hypothetical protein